MRVLIQIVALHGKLIEEMKAQKAALHPQRGT